MDYMVGFDYEITDREGVVCGVTLYLKESNVWVTSWDCFQMITHYMDPAI